MNVSLTRTIWHWGGIYALCGVLAALGHHLIQDLAGPSPWWVVPQVMSCVLLLTALGYGQWWLLRAWMPTLSRWWVVITVAAATALFAAYTSLDLRVAHALVPMVRQVFNDVGMPGWLGGSFPFAVLRYVGFILVGTALAQAPLVHRHLRIGLRWVGVNALAAVVMCLAVASLTRLAPFAPSALVSGDLWSWFGNAVVTALAYAALGAATGASLAQVIRQQCIDAPIELSAGHGEVMRTWPY